MSVACAALEAADCPVDLLKIVAEFWKHEVGEADSEWIEPTAIDYSHRERWS